jgi:hypothetical protein
VAEVGIYELGQDDVRRLNLLKPAEDSSSAERSKPKPKQSTRIVELVAGQLELFHTPDGDAFAGVKVDDHCETHSLRSGPFRRWLQRCYYADSGDVPNAQAVQDALGVLEGEALFAGDEQPVYTRVAELDGTIYVNLADAAWRAVEITADGWSVISDPPVRFRRPKGMLALPLPESGGSIDGLGEFVNAHEDDLRLMTGWVVGAYQPHGSYAICSIHGEAGSAKSTGCRVLRGLVDPNVAPLRSLPCDERDLAISARNAWVLGYDNLSNLSPRHSDALCRISTGEGLATRALFTDDDEMIFQAQRPIILNGIEELGGRGDLLDRSLVVTLPRIPDQKRRPETEFWSEFIRVRPRLLGAIFDGVAMALARRDEVRLERLPRMADFAIWMVAAERGLGWADGTFLAAYEGNRAEANELTLEASPIARSVRDLAADAGFFGTATDLLEQLRSRVSDEAATDREWPKNGRALSGRLRRIAPNLRAVGVGVDFEQPLPSGSRRGIRINPQLCVRSVGCVNEPITETGQRDAADAKDVSVGGFSLHALTTDSNDANLGADSSPEAGG